MKNKAWDKAGRGLGGGETRRETEQEKNIKEEGQEREKERLLERGARRSPGCCQVPGFPSPLHKRTAGGLNWEGGQERRRAHSQKKALHSPFTPPTSTSWQQLESTIIPSSAIWHSSTSQLSSPLLPHSSSITDATRTHIHPDTKVHKGAYPKVLWTAAPRACGNVSLTKPTITCPNCSSTEHCIGWFRLICNILCIIIHQIEVACELLVLCSCASECYRVSFKKLVIT